MKLTQITFPKQEGESVRIINY